MNQLLLQVVIVVTFAALCFGGGYLTAFIVTRNQWRDQMIERGRARYNWHTGKWEWGEPPKKPTTWGVRRTSEQTVRHSSVYVRQNSPGWVADLFPLRRDDVLRFPR